MPAYQNGFLSYKYRNVNDNIAFALIFCKKARSSIRKHCKRYRQGANAIWDESAWWVFGSSNSASTRIQFHLMYPWPATIAQERIFWIDSSSRLISSMVMVAGGAFSFFTPALRCCRAPGIVNFLSYSRCFICRISSTSLLR